MNVGKGPVGQRVECQGWEEDKECRARVTKCTVYVYEIIREQV